MKENNTVAMCLKNPEKLKLISNSISHQRSGNYSSYLEVFWGFKYEAIDYNIEDIIFDFGSV